MLDLFFIHYYFEIPISGAQIAPRCPNTESTITAGQYDVALKQAAGGAAKARHYVERTTQARLRARLSLTKEQGTTFKHHSRNTRTLGYVRHTVERDSEW